jgi:hypothetical protein
VRLSSARTRSVCASMVALAVTVVCSLPQPAAAQSRSTASTTSAASPAAATRSLTTLSASSLALLQRSEQSAQTPTTSSRSFFKTPKGAAVLALLGAGFGYALYSRFHDEIKSPIREQ